MISQQIDEIEKQASTESEGEIMKLTQQKSKISLSSDSILLNAYNILSDIISASVNVNSEYEELLLIFNFPTNPILKDINDGLNNIKKYDYSGLIKYRQQLIDSYIKNKEFKQITNIIADIKAIIGDTGEMLKTLESSEIDIEKEITSLNILIKQMKEKVKNTENVDTLEIKFVDKKLGITDDKQQDNTTSDNTTPDNTTSDNTTSDNTTSDNTTSDNTKTDPDESCNETESDNLKGGGNDKQTNCVIIETIEKIEEQTDETKETLNKSLKYKANTLCESLKTWFEDNQLTL
jgi:hypothetical protein